MSKPPHKNDDDNASSGSDTESESEEDEDTVGILSYFSIILFEICFSGVDRESKSSSIHDQFVFS